MEMNSDPFERIAAQFVANVARRIPPELSTIIWSSPLSARNSDVCLLWHPGYRNNRPWWLALRLTCSLVSACGKGVARLVRYGRSLPYVLQGTIDQTILVVPDTCGYYDRGVFQTGYVLTEHQDALFVFGAIGASLPGARYAQALSLRKQIRLGVLLGIHGVIAFHASVGGLWERTVLFLEWMRWVVAMQWLQEYYLEQSFDGFMQKYGIKKVGCVHEMHAYTRVIWKIAKRYGASTYTVQHSSLSEGKRWYICYPEEIDNGLVLPDVMYVYHQEVAVALQALYGQTRFMLGCSARYAHWKNAQKRTGVGKYYLFVGALAGFDNTTILTSLRLLLRYKHPQDSIRLRLHPFAQISYREGVWIKQQKNHGTIALSTNVSIRDDIEHALVVVGMSTTVLQEAMLLGVPVIRLSHPDYLCYVDMDGVEGVETRDYRALTLDTLQETAHLSVSAELMQERLGLQYPVVTYAKLFE